MKKLFQTEVNSRVALLVLAIIVAVALYQLGLLSPAEFTAPLLLGMSQMTPAQARVIDPILTTAAQGYKNPDFIGESLFPTVPVEARGGKIITFGREDFELYSTVRAPGTATKRVQFGYSGASFALEDHSLEGVVPIENSQEAAAVRRTQNIIALRKEKAQADLALTAANYPASNKITLAGTDQWSDYVAAASDPSDDIEIAKEAIRNKTGKRPNTVVLGALVWSKLKYHPKMIDRIKYTGRDSLTLEMVAALWEVKRVVVGDAVYMSGAGVQTDIWGKFAVLAFTEIGSLAEAGLPSYGYTYQLRGYPLAEQPYYERNPKSWIYPVSDVLQPVIASNIAGYLITGAVA